MAFDGLLMASSWPPLGLPIATATVIRYEGTKHWSLWSPFPITTDADADSDAAGQGHAYPPRTFPTHTRFETTLEEGDSLFFAPGFYHGTRILTVRPTALGSSLDGPCLLLMALTMAPSIGP